MRFKIAPHMIRAGEQAVEVWSDDDRLLGMIYSHERGVHVTSKHYAGSVSTGSDGTLVLLQVPPKR